MTAVRYIAIDGVIGVGKTSLVHRLQAERGGRRFLELVEENPFLTGGFYNDMERLAFDTELFFLLARFRQQREVAEALRKSNDLVLSDYLFEKNRIFASLTLSGRDFMIWERIYEALLPEVPRPDLVVYLRSTTGRLLDRIHSRSRPFERDITEPYLNRVNASYERFFASYAGRLLTIDVSQLDFVWSDADFAAVRALVDHRIAALEAGQGELELPVPGSRESAGKGGA
ncbi:MAG TPA: deoxynucleoside kinase [Gemmatimonadota bacterium]|nr:deoxynucleoside kinase [Gemmatimonadota bacterium]